MRTLAGRAWARLGFSAAALAISGVACGGGEENDAAAGSGGQAGFAAGGGGLTAGTAGLPGSGGGAGSAMGGMANGGTAGSATGGAPAGCDNPQGLIDPAALPECPTCMGQPAHCAPKSVVEATAPDQVDSLLPCDETNLCVPDVLIDTNGMYDPPACESIGGGAGRCLSVCIGQVAELAGQLPRANCPEGELCAPCVDPRTGEETGACNLTCDTGPHEPRFVFPRCCEGDVGVCVPPDLVDESQQDALAQRSCDEGQLCAPENLADPTYVPPTCESVGGAEGRCLSTCVELVASQADLLPQDSCGDGELCAPCFDPRTGEETNACRINGDEPTTEGTTFARCCENDIGICVPPDLVPENQRDALARRTCEEGELCAPEVLADPSYKPESCRSLQDTEGRCLSTCVELVAAQASLLPQGDCPDGELCAPCYDPRSGEDTSACRINGDEPVEEPPEPFARCCEGDIGICVPPDLVSESQRGGLSRQSCDEGLLCTPEVLADPSFKPASCDSVADAEGRCLSTCVALVAEQSDLLPQSTCEAGELCAPCYDPRTGDQTPACSINGDAPTEDPVVFDKECCGTTGLCVPSVAVPEEQRALLVEDNCGTEGENWVCAPKLKLDDINAPFETCDALLLGIVPIGDGACVPECITDGQIDADPLTAAGISQSDCDDGWMCAPCENPLSGDPTGACD